jgi:hypothetical protein
MSLNGTLVITKFGGTAVVGEVSSSLDFAYDLIETTVKASSARSKTYETGENGMTFSVESKVAQADGAAIVALQTAAKAGTAQAFVIASTVVGDLTVSGNGLISGISISNPQNDVRTISYNLTATGAFTVGVVTV